jgi:hypothetical protein
MVAHYAKCAGLPGRFPMSQGKEDFAGLELAGKITLVND